MKTSFEIHHYHCVVFWLNLHDCELVIQSVFRRQFRQNYLSISEYFTQVDPMLIHELIVMNRSLRCKQFLFKFFSIDWYLKGIKMFYHLWASTGGHFCIYILSIFWTEPKSEISDRCSESRCTGIFAASHSPNKCIYNLKLSIQSLLSPKCQSSHNQLNFHSSTLSTLMIFHSGCWHLRT